MGVTSENSAWNLVGFDQDSTQHTFLRRRQLINGSMVFAHLPRISEVIDDLAHGTSPTSFSVAVQLIVDVPTTATTYDITPTSMLMDLGRLRRLYHIHIIQ